MNRRHPKSHQLVVYRCENCQHEVELDLKELKELRKNRPHRADQSNHPPGDGLDLPVCVELTYLGFWITRPDGRHDFTTDEQCDRNSVMVSTESLLYVYKLALRHYLLAKKIITPKEIDAANLVPHVVVRKSKTDPFSYYHKIQGETFIITEDKLSAKADFLIIELDERLGVNLHMTLIYSKKIKQRVDLIATFKLVLRTLNQHPEMIPEYRNLADFGLGEVNYWYENETSFPLAIRKPKDYVSTVVRVEPRNYQLSPAGTIIK